MPTTLTPQQTAPSAPASPQKLPDTPALEQSYYPSLVALDALVTCAEELLYKRELADRGTYSAAEYAMKAPDYQGPDPETWSLFTTLLEVRNEIAQMCNVRKRQRQDQTVGYELDPKEQHRSKLPRVDSAHIYLAGAPASMQPPMHVNSVPATFKASSLPIDQLEECYLPILTYMDYVISKIERRIWNETHKTHMTVQQAQAIIWDPNHNSPNALRRNRLLSVRNQIAELLGTPNRDRKHDLVYPARARWFVDAQEPPSLDAGRDEIPVAHLKPTP